jgi:lipopolysaccharide export LptBFGC system permease protein LptF
MVDDHTTLTHASPSEHATDQASTGELISRLSQEVSLLVRDEMKLAQLEITAKAKKAGIGAGLFGVAGILALFGAGVLVATAVLALALALDAWLAALIVGVALLAIAGVAALMGRSEVQQATPPVPQEAIESVQQDIDAVKRGAHR